jgi:hypothetical protein
MKVWQIDPLLDDRWPEFLELDPRASVFHTRGWLQALRHTYDYRPVVYTTTEPGQRLSNGWVFCRVQNWITGKRLVSLPFSDHCDPLVESPEQLHVLAHSLTKSQPGEGWDYVECRPLRAVFDSEEFQSSKEFCFHKLDLAPDLSDLFRALHKDSTQRKIKRAERESISFAEGSSAVLLDHFYHLLVLTRRRHKRLPQPRKWFSILAARLGDNLKVRVAYCNGVPIAAVLTLRFKTKLVYKYGGADQRYFHLGGMQSLLWRAIEDAKQTGVVEFDLGRSDLSNRGLIVFKNRLGAIPSTLKYFRYPGRRQSWSFASAASEFFGEYVRFMPTRMLVAGGSLLYKYFG